MEITIMITASDVLIKNRKNTAGYCHASVLATHTLHVRCQSIDDLLVCGSVTTADVDQQQALLLYIYGVDVCILLCFT